MEAGDVLKFYVGIIVVMFFIWIFMGGPKSKDGTHHSFFSPPTIMGQSGTAKKEPQRTKEEIEADLQTAKEKAETIQKGIEEIKISSPYKGKVSLGVGLARNTTLAQQYVTLQVSPLFKEPIVISGWKIRSKITGRSAIIGQAPKIPALPSRPQLEPIVIKAGDTITMSTGRSPVQTSFRVNLCTGYFSESKTFTPYLRSDCPRTSSDPRLTPYNYDDQCLDYIETIPQCRRPKNIPQNLTISCKDYLNNEISYSSCVKANEKIATFLKNEWRIYLQSDTLLWKQKREELELIDANNKLVDTLTYK